MRIISDWDMVQALATVLSNQQCPVCRRPLKTVTLVPGEMCTCDEARDLLARFQKVQKERTA